MNDIKERVMAANAKRSNQTRELLGEDTSNDIPDAVAASLAKLADANGGSVELRPSELHERSGAPLTFKKFVYLISEPEFTDALGGVGVKVAKSQRYFADTKQTQTIYTVTHTMDKPAMGGA